MKSYSALLLALSISHAALAATSTPARPLLERALAGPMQDVSEIIFCTRLPYNDPHWYANIGYYCDDDRQKAYTGNGKPDDSKLYKWNCRTGALTVLLDAQGGSIRDPQVHYDGNRIVFAYRKAATDFYHLYEIRMDGSGLRQLTSGAFDDYEPTYLADGGIAFVSTRCNRWVNCWKTQVGVIYRCNSDGSNIELISANTEHDNTPWPLPDGRLLYTRWEYVDRSQVEFHHLWTMNPDGTGQMVFYGNMRPHTVMIDAKPVPDSEWVIASFSPGHGMSEHAGTATLVSPRQGPDAPAAVRPLHKGWTVDPIALATNCVLAGRGKDLVLLDGSGRMEVLFSHPGPGALHEPRPVQRRPREAVLARRIDPQSASGRMMLADVYEGRNLPGVQRGEIKKLLVLESLPKPVNFSGGPDLVSWLGTFTLERVLGTVPVEPDGSAYFEVPADRQIFFVALDENDLSVKRMQSFTTAMPGETVSCVGCHEHREKAAVNRAAGIPLAARREPSRIERFDGHPDVLDFTRDIQPILDRHCVRCHGYPERQGKVSLAGDLGPQWSHSFFTLFARLQVADGRNGLGNQPPRSIGSAASPLLAKLAGGHHDVKATPKEWRTVWLWIESGAAYAGTYAALRNEQEQARSGEAMQTVFQAQAALLGRRCYGCHNQVDQSLFEDMRLPFNYEERRKKKGGLNRAVAVYERLILENDPIARFSANILLNFSRPAMSPLLLGPLSTNAGGFGSCGPVFLNTEDADYQALLAAISAGKQRIEVTPRFPTTGFQPNAQYVREMKKYGVLPASFEAARDAVDAYATDQQYWRSLWYKPRAPVAP